MADLARTPQEGLESDRVGSIGTLQSQASPARCKSSPRSRNTSIRAGTAQDPVTDKSDLHALSVSVQARAWWGRMSKRGGGGHGASLGI